jgi:hypothetical protein
MSPERTSGLLLRLYPAGWRARYGEELEGLILEASGQRVPWRVRLDVVFAAGRERLRGAGLVGDRPPVERMRGGALLVLCAWALFVVPGVLVQRVSEHWQAATPVGSRGLPAGAFDALLVGAVVGGALVVVGVAVALPSLARLLRSGGRRPLRRHLLVAVGLSLGAVPASVGVVVWAHGLSPGARNGGDAAYETAVVLWSLLLVACLAAWTVAGVALARRLDLSAAMLRLEALLSVGVASTLVGMTAATAVWWAALARSAPWFLAGAAVGSPASPLSPALVVAAILMLVAVAAGAGGAGRALRAAGEAR